MLNFEASERARERGESGKLENVIGRAVSGIFRNHRMVARTSASIRVYVLETNVRIFFFFISIGGWKSAYSLGTNHDY